MSRNPATGGSIPPAKQCTEIQPPVDKFLLSTWPGNPSTGERIPPAKQCPEIRPPVDGFLRQNNAPKSNHRWTDSSCKTMSRNPATGGSVPLANLGKQSVHRNSFSSAYNPRGLDYALEVIETLASESSGIYECIFFDMSPQYPFENIMTDLMQSPRLQYVARYVVRGSFRPATLPKKPLLLLLDPGEAKLKNRDEQMIIYKFLKVFHPATKVLVFIDLYDEESLVYLRWILLQAKCYKMLFLDPNRHIFEWYQEKLRGNNITYTSVSSWDSFPDFQWLKATVDYLGGNAFKSLAKYDDDNYDINLRQTIAESTKDDDFRRIFLNEPEVGIEIAKRSFPDLIRNDPTLLAICGYERSNLHHAGRLEKIVLLSLVVLVFFMTNAFETKIISYIIDIPSGESAKSLEDFDKFGLSFRFNLENESFAKDHPVIGQYVVHDTNSYHVSSTVPGVALYVNQKVIAVLSSLSYDFERGKTWFVELDQKFMIHPVQIFYTGIRNQYLETFRFTRVALHEAGLMDWWQWKYGQLVVKHKWGTRPRGAEDGKTYLVFDDMLLAWIVLALGCGLTLNHLTKTNSTIIATAVTSTREIPFP
ncbi:conserved hypothetical protein [Culex quinquefasciatus]|uniref:Uncharacterized protein n=1 Tax=Culex quinquefasciatus TaxID=7176 RepID=B0WJJ5_CULQU|nr:conserved hypothetical protein [Culex quinquefasciatus]|eukprot:XP_001848879.1 conserved hypothetical protein [Culex quinquefasciatus]